MATLNCQKILWFLNHTEPLLFTNRIGTNLAQFILSNMKTALTKLYLSPHLQQGFG
jgi:hypothetical protein